MRKFILDEDQNSKNSLGSLVSTSELKENDTKSGNVRARLHRSSDALKRGSQNNLYGLTPESAAKAEQPVLIFNPANEEYIFVSNDMKNSEKQNFYVESTKKTFSDTTLFLIKKVPNVDNKYYIYNPKKERYLYISKSKSGFMKIFYRRNNVLASPVEPKRSKDESKYVFEFELGNDAYRIKQGELYLYISKDTKGVFFSKPILKAVRGFGCSIFSVEPQKGKINLLPLMLEFLHAHLSFVSSRFQLAYILAIPLCIYAYRN